MTDLFLFGITAAKRKGRNLLLLKVMAENTTAGKQLLENIESHIEHLYTGSVFFIKGSGDVLVDRIKLVRDDSGYHNR